MLHLIGLILKIIGIILAVILGILVLLVCIVLLVPVWYAADVDFPGNVSEIKAHGSVSWLIHLIRLKVSFENGELKWKLGLVWLRFSSEAEKDKEAAPKEKRGKKEGEDHRLYLMNRARKPGIWGRGTLNLKLQNQSG